MAKLFIDDILDLRQYEKVREEKRKEIIDLKRIRRVGVGPFISLVFENQATMQFQIQEMARAERIIEERLLQDEIDIYNNLIPERGEISITLLIELTSKEELYFWLPKLVGIENSLYLELHFNGLSNMQNELQLLRDNTLPGHILNESNSVLTIKASVQEEHQEMLTRANITASVHYLKFQLSESEQKLFPLSDIIIRFDHTAYRHEANISKELQTAITGDW